MDGWLALEADTIVTGGQGGLRRVPRAERAEARRAYLASMRFRVYRDLDSPIVEISRDGTLGWVYARVEITGDRVTDRGTEPVHDTWTWIELYRNTPTGWRLTGNVSAREPAPRDD